MHKIHFFGGFQISPNAIIPLSESRVCYGPLTEYEGRISWLSKRLKVIISNVYFFFLFHGTLLHGTINHQFILVYF